MKDDARVRRFRKLMQMTQAEAAEWWGCTVRAWQRYEAGDRRVPKPLLNEMHRCETVGLYTTPKRK